jgi:hypothetical protein
MIQIEANMGDENCEGGGGRQCLERVGERVNLEFKCILEKN